MRRFGYHGRVLHIDLTNRSSRLEEKDDAFWRVYGGGGLLGAYYLLSETPAGLDPFDSDARLVFASSIAAGHPYAGLARFTVVAKSPLTNGIGEARCEGPFGQGLKGSGADALVFHGVASEPLAVLIENARVSFLPAEGLWGQTVSHTVDELERQLGPEIYTAAIGPAGENIVRYASIVTQRTYQVSRMGLGAVMGSKKLKAVVLRGDNRPPVAAPERCAELTDSYRERMVGNPLTRWQLDPPGFSAWIHLHGTDAALCTRNYSESVFAHAENYRPEEILRHYRKDAPCPGCPNNCIKVLAPNESSAADLGAAGIHQEITGALGSNLELSDINAVFEANVLCNELGLDPVSLGFTLSMVMECVERGIVKEADIGLPLRFGASGAVLKMIGKIAMREGFGDLLAEGAARAARRIGPEAAKYALHVKGLEMVPFEPRTQTNLALGYATAPVGPRYEICEHDWDYDTSIGWPHTLEHSRTLGILERIPMAHLGADKVRNYKALNTIWSGADALDLCLFAIAPTRIFSLHEMAEMVGAVTGWNTSSYEIMRYGERRNHIMRVYNLREGLTSEQDTLPDRFFDDPIPSGSWAGHRLDREAFSSAVQTYYAMMGWDEIGRPRFETLIDHHLEWLEEDGHAVRC